MLSLKNQKIISTLLFVFSNFFSSLAMESYSKDKPTIYQKIQDPFNEIKTIKDLFEQIKPKVNNFLGTSRQDQTTRNNIKYIFSIYLTSFFNQNWHTKHEIEGNFLELKKFYLEHQDNFFMKYIDGNFYEKLSQMVMIYLILKEITLTKTLSQIISICKKDLSPTTLGKLIKKGFGDGPTSFGHYLKLPLYLIIFDLANKSMQKNKLSEKDNRKEDDCEDDSKEKRSLFGEVIPPKEKNEGEQPTIIEYPTF